ncbi:eukaryotic peptide chain release factor subunit 1-3-like protein [Trifolium pratense]|uniref:Eukaryotic peptide chain release factor subunit 1-3-like protein n=1 Tax=Trifolium pratense TaxID=57577 RepID=A0A2K3PBR1_TRIPR|nr:eukaryotic peptide chain release factor subunit 1-3-like protein [Trifolium pratense]
MADAHDTDKNIEVWKIKKLIKALEAARGNGTSMISLIMPPRDQIARVTKMLGDEFGTASNIKSRVNRQSVLGAITSAQQRLKLYNKVPPNGLVLYTGTIVTDDGKEKKVTIDFEPFRPINASLYLCDNKFHTEALNELLESDDKFGFIVMDGNGTLFGTLSGNTREVLHKFSVDLPKKHGRGGQSALRFARLRMEKRHNYVRKTAELATQFYINPATSQPNVSGLILAGSADFKTELSQSDMFDPRLQAKILNVVDVSYGGENGFNQAIELSAEILSNVKFIQEKRLIGKYFEEISQDTGKYVFGVDDTLQALDAGAVETLIVWENLDMTRYVLKNTTTGEVVIKHYNKEQEANQSNFRDPESNADYEEREAKIPAPVLEAAAWAAAAPPPLTPRLSVVLHGKSDCEKSCFAPKELSYMALQISETLLTTSGENRSFPIPLLSACIHKGKNTVILPKEHNIASTKSLLNLLSDVTQQSFDEEVVRSLSDQVFDGE